MKEALKAQCQFCHKDLVLYVNSEDMDIADDGPVSIAMRLLPLVACTRCAGLRVRRRGIIAGLRVVQSSLYGNQSDQMKEAAERLLRAYVRLVSDWMNIEPSMDWDPAIMDSFLGRPSELGSVLNSIWHSARHQQEQTKLL